MPISAAEHRNEAWVVTLPCKNSGQAYDFVRELKTHALGKNQVCVNERAYVVYGTDVVLLRTICKMGAEKGYMTEEDARKTLNQEARFLLRRTRVVTERR